MADKVIVLVHDDWEIRGNGTGDVAHLQYLPALHLLNLADELGFKVTFMAEVMQQLAMTRFAAQDRHLRLQSVLWQESVQLFADRGHDVQLHIHPHWHDALYQQGRFQLGRNWNLATYADAERRTILASAVSYLQEVMRGVSADYRVHTFKAGSWGLQPSGPILRDLDQLGMRVVMGVGKGIVLNSPEFHADYRALQETLLPYYPVYDDVLRVSAQPTPIVMLPLPYYSLGLRGTLSKVGRFARGGRRVEPAHSTYQLASRLPVDSYSPLQTPPRSRADRLFGREIKTLDVSGALFEELRPAIDQIMARCLAAPVAAVPLTIQGHTKGYHGRWTEVSRFYRYLVETYSRHIEFMTMSDFVRVLPEIEVVQAQTVAAG